MQTREFSGDAERRLLIWGIQHTEFVSRISGRIGKDPWRSSDCNLIWTWIEEHFSKYHVATGDDIVSYFQKWAIKAKDETQHRRVEGLLSSLSKEAGTKSLNLDHSLDVAENHLNQIRLERHKDELEDMLEKGATANAVAAAAGFIPLLLRSAPFIDLLKDKEAHRSAYEDKQKLLIKHSGPAEKFFGSELSEDSFVAFMASPKGGKSYSLLDLAWRAMKQGKKVAYFQIGDLSRNQLILRFGKRILYRPLIPRTYKYPISIILPSGVRELAVVDYKTKTHTDHVTHPMVLKVLEEITRKKKGGLRISYHPTCTIGVPGIKSILDSWDNEEYKAQVVIIDYAGNLSHQNQKQATHEQVGHSWGLMRQLSETRRCLLVTAQQSNKEGFSSWVLTRKNFRESLMILAHVTAFIGINMTDEEKQRGIMRYNFVTRREDAFSETHCLYNASCLDTANPCVVSCLPEEK